MNKSTRLVSLMMLTAAIAACGGGGGDAGAPPVGGPSPAPAPGPAPGPAPAPVPPPPAPTLQATGLGPATLSLNASTNPTDTGLIASLVVLAQKMVDAGVVSDEAAAAQAVARVSGNPAPFTCPGGGQITTGAPNSLGYANCGTAGGYAFNGNATIATNAGGYTLTYSGLTATGANAPNDPISGNTTCTTTGGDPNCVTTLGSFRWGYDVTFANGVANGTHQCTCVNNQTWNVVFKDFGPTSGTAYVYATNGVATATRTGANSFSVTQTVNGVTTGPVPFNL